MPIRRDQHRGQDWLEVPIEGRRNALLRPANFRIWVAGGGGERGVEMLQRIWVVVTRPLEMMTVLRFVLGGDKWVEEGVQATSFRLIRDPKSRWPKVKICV